MTYLDHPISLAFPIFLLFFSVISKHLPWLNAFAGVFRQTERLLQSNATAFIFIQIMIFNFSNKLCDIENEAFRACPADTGVGNGLAVYTLADLL